MEKTFVAGAVPEDLAEAAAQYLPREPESLESQRLLLQMLTDVVSPIQVCMAKAEQNYWPRVAKLELDMAKAIRFSAKDIDYILRITKVENLNMEDRTQQDLMKAWTVANYYCGRVNGQEIPSLKAFHSRLTALLEEKIQTSRRVEELAAMISAMEELEEPTEHPQETTVPAESGGKSGSQGKGAIKPAVLAAAAAAVLAVALVFVLPMFSKVNQTEKAIAAIGEVSLASGDAIAAAEASYAALEEGKQAKVDNYALLEAARSTYDCLLTEEAIAAIGKVTMESEAAIAQAEEYYAALNPEQKELVGNVNARTLTTARREYDRLEKAVDDAVKAIKAIGTVTLDSSSKIRTARRAYDALSKDGLQSYVKHEYGILAAAETKYIDLASQDLYAQALPLLEKGSYQDALVLFNTIINDYPSTNAAKQSKASAQSCRLKLAEQACNKGDQYTAMSLVKQMDSSFTNSEEVKALKEKILNKLTASRPKTGNRIIDKASWGYCKLQIIACTKDVCVKVISVEDPSKYTMVYVRAGETTELGLKDGDYYVKMTTGDYWYNKDVGFGDEAEYKKAGGRISMSTYHSGGWVYYRRYQLNLQYPSKGHITLTSSTKSDFWG